MELRESERGPMKHRYAGYVAVRVPGRGTGTGTDGYGKIRTGYVKNVPGTFALFWVRDGTTKMEIWVRGSPLNLRATVVVVE